uniref:Lipocalin n=1 Tax=Amblyomma americanum TaxID=6943 RepID=A0A0C9SE09_AMBAM
MNFFAVTIFLALGVTAFGYTDKPELQDLVEALKTDNKIWLAWRSYQMQTSEQYHRCNYVVKTAPPAQYRYHFKQHFMYGGTRGDKDLTVDISASSRGEPVLTVSNSSGASVLYTMRFWDPDNHCFILTFQGNRQWECELHLWNQDVEKLDTNPLYYCMQDYDILCGGRKYELYTPDCKNPY